MKCAHIGTHLSQSKFGFTKYFLNGIVSTIAKPVCMAPQVQLLTKLVSPAVSQGSDSVRDHVLKDRGGTQKWKGHLLVPQNPLGRVVNPSGYKATSSTWSWT